MLASLLLVYRMIAPEQQPAMNLRMQSFHAPAKHLRPAGKVRHIAYRKPGVAQQLRGSPSGKNLNAQRRQPLSKLHNPRLVKNADKRPLDHDVALRKTKYN